MRKILTLLLITACIGTSFAAVNAKWADQFSDNTELQSLNPQVTQIGMDQFLALTPAKYQELTGEKLSIAQTISLKAAQKYVKKHSGADDDIPKGLYIVLALLGWSFVAMGILDNWEGNNWWVNLILTMLCWLPGFIHALVKMKDYYK